MMIIRVGTEIRITGEYKGKTYSESKPYIIDLQPVEEFNELLERMIGKEQACRERRLAGGINDLVEKAGKMNQDQVGYLVSGLLGQIQKWTQLYQDALDHPDKFAAFVKQYREITTGAGPYLEMLRELGDSKVLEQNLKIVDDVNKCCK